jgi:PAS domain S-box-containing protein
MLSGPESWVWLGGAAVAGALLAGLVTYKVMVRRLKTSCQIERERTEAYLRQSENKFRRLVEANLIGVSVGNLDGQIIEANQYYLDMLGYTRDDLNAGAINWVDMTPLKYAEIDRQAVQDQRLLGQCAPFEKEYFRKDGSLVPVLMGHVVYDENQEHSIGFLIDLSDRKQAEALSVLEERSRLARDIHDSLAQAFTSILVHLEVAERKLDDDPTTTRTCLHTSAEVAQAGLADARRAMKALRPYHLDQANLHDALCQISRQIFAHSAIQVRSSQTGCSYKLQPEVEDALLRIGQEALSNAFKHSQATVVRLNLSYEPDQCVLRIQDNGVGFASTPDQTNTPDSVEHFGLTGMAERSQRINAELVVESVLNQGTAITVVVPQSLA